MSLEVNVRLSSKREASGHSYEDLYSDFQNKEKLQVEDLEELIEEIDYSIKCSESGHDIQRLEELRNLVKPYAEKRRVVRDTPRRKFLSQYSEDHKDVYKDLFNIGDFVLTIRDLAANDGSLISAGLEGKIINKYETDRQNTVYVVKVNGKDVSTFSENIRTAMKLSTAGDDPSYVDSGTDCPSGPQDFPGGDTVRTHSPLSLYHEKLTQKVTWKFNPQTKEWEQVFERIAKLVNGQVLPTPATVSPFASRLQDLNINYQSNPQGTYNSQQVVNTLNNTILTQEEQTEIENKQNQNAEQEYQQDANTQQQKTGASGNITNTTDHDRSQLEGENEGRLKTDIDIDGPNQSHQIQTKNKDDDDVFDWLPSPYDQGEDGNYKTTEGPKFWL